MNEDLLMVQKFYSTWHEPLFWLSSRKNIKKAHEWLKVMESDKHSGYIPDGAARWGTIGSGWRRV
jgi:hypothetical protein